MRIAAPGQLISVSHVAADPLSSPRADEARGFILNRGQAEEIFALDPDLVLASDWSDPFATAMLERLGVRVARLPNVTKLGEIPDVTRQVGALLGREEEAEALAAEVEAALHPPDPDDARPTAAFFFAGGYSPGPASLSYDIVSMAGFAVRDDESVYVALEELLIDPPDILVVGEAYAGASRAEALTRHPALDGIPRVVATAHWVCGTPDSLDALREMREAREAFR